MKTVKALFIALVIIVLVLALIRVFGLWPAWMIEAELIVKAALN